MPDLASVMLTGLLVPMNMNVLNLAVYWVFRFSLTTISSWDTIEFSFVLSSILLRSPSCCMDTRGLSRNISKAKELLKEARALASNVL